jgi:hypothetical protein
LKKETKSEETASKQAFFSYIILKEIRMKLPIPKSFTIFAHKFKVLRSNDLVQREGAVGIYRHTKQEITVQNNIDGTNLTQTRIEQTYCHELVHAILGEICEEELCQNEKFVDLFAQGLHQALSSAKY